MKRIKILVTVTSFGMLLLTACQGGTVPNVTIPEGNGNVQLLSAPQSGLDDTASRAGLTGDDAPAAASDDGTADQGQGDVVVVAPTTAPTTGAPANDDGTADQGQGDVVVNPTEVVPGAVGNDDGTADQGKGDVVVNGTPAPAANVGNEVEFSGVISAIGNGFITINGQNVFIGNITEVKGTLEANATVKVHVFVDGNGNLSAREVKVLVAADGTVVDDNCGQHDGADDGPNHDANDDHGGSNSGSDDGASHNSGGDTSGQSSSSDNSGSGSGSNSGGGSNSGSSGGGDDGGHHGGNDH